jgi:hypothetical protein
LGDRPQTTLVIVAVAVFLCGLRGAVRVEFAIA